jgi:hypothetical protein
MSFRKWPPKDPDAIKDYSINWAQDDDGNPGLYAGDELASSEWIVPAGITKTDESFTPEGLTTIWLSGGTDKASYTLTNRITTAGGRTDDRSVVLPIKQQ